MSEIQAVIVVPPHEPYEVFVGITENQKPIPVKDPFGKQIGTGVAKVDDEGRILLDITLDESVKLAALERARLL